jgi:excinuclease ABC subunit C
MVRFHSFPILWKIKKKLDETDAELLELAIIELRAFSIVISGELSFFPVDLGEQIKAVPQLGIKKNKRIWSI